MKLYLKICSSVYYFYNRRKDSLPEAMTLWVTTLILTLNLITIYDFLRFYFFKELPNNIGLGFIVFILVALVNYIFVIRKAYFKDISPTKKTGLFIIFYIILTFALLVYIGSLHREQNLLKMNR